MRCGQREWRRGAWREPPTRAGTSGLSDEALPVYLAAVLSAETKTAAEDLDGLEKVSRARAIFVSFYPLARARTAAMCTVARASACLAALVTPRTSPLRARRGRTPPRGHDRPVVTRFQKDPHGKWWDAVPTDATASDLAPILDDLSCRRALTAALELSVEMCFQAYDDAGRVESLERWLMTRLGENLRLTESQSGRALPAGFTPAGMLRKVLRDSPHGRDVEAVVDSLAAELKRRFASRRQTLRDRKVCITWRGVATNLSTMSRANTVDVSTALAMPDDDFDVALDALLAVGSGDFSLKEKGTTGVFLANAGWSSRGSHLP